MSSRFTSIPKLHFNRNGAMPFPTMNGHAPSTNGHQSSTEVPVDDIARSAPPAPHDPPAPSSPDASAQSPGPALDAADAADDRGGVHAITKRTNYWFECEIHEIESRAEQWAQEWAHRGLPRHDLARTEPLEPEQVISSLCGQLFRDWQLRVRTKVQDAIADTGEELGRHVATLRAKASRLESIKLDIDEREQRIERLRDEAARDERPVRYGGLISKWAFWSGALALGLVEFMANFPVFRLLLPMNAALAKVASTAADQVDTDSLWSGPRMLLAEWTTHIEAVIVAMVAVIILVVLGKFAGRSMRAWLALDPTDFPGAARTIRAHRREFGFKGVASAAGIACVLTFLFFSRGDIAGLAAERVKQAEGAVSAAKARVAEATSADDASMAEANEELLQLREVQLNLEEDGRYASTVQRNNVPILFLNLALVITAAVLGFGAASADLDDRRGEHPDLVRLREKCVELRAEQIVVDHEGRAALAQANMAASRINHLLDAHPLRGWESKVRRLESVIPRFRGENARLRGMDTANIVAFNAPQVLDLPPVREELDLVEPPEFKRLRDEVLDLGTALARLAPRLTPRRSLEAL